MPPSKNGIAGPTAWNTSPPIPGASALAVPRKAPDIPNMPPNFIGVYPLGDQSVVFDILFWHHPSQCYNTQEFLTHLRYLYARQLDVY